MSVVTRDAARAAALEIKGETVEDANTAARVGGLFENLVDSVAFDAPAPFVRASFPVDDSGTTNSTSLTTVATFDTSALPNACVGIAKAYVAVQDASNALAMQLIEVGFQIIGGALTSGGAGSLLEGSLAQGAASFGYSANDLLVQMTSSDNVIKTYKVWLEATYVEHT